MSFVTSKNVKSLEPLPLQYHRDTRRAGQSGHTGVNAGTAGGIRGVEVESELLQRLDRIEAALQVLVQEKTIKDWYTTAEVASLIRRAEFTVREWCRLGRIHASKRACGRGLSHEWIISHAELTRLRNEGLLPLPKHA